MQFYEAPILDKTAKVHKNGDNHIQKFHFGEVYHWPYGLELGFMALLGRRHKTKFPIVYTSRNENFEYSYTLKVYIPRVEKSSNPIWSEC